MRFKMSADQLSRRLWYRRGVTLGSRPRNKCVNNANSDCGWVRYVRSIKAMEPLNMTDVTRIATEAAGQLSPRLRVVGVTRGAADGDYAEVVVDVVGGHKEPCRLSLGVFRNTSASVLRHEITDKLRMRLRPEFLAVVDRRSA